MEHPPYFTPEQKYLRTVYMFSLFSAEPSGAFAAWLLTGVAAILGLIIANIESVTRIISEGGLRLGIIFLTLSMLSGVFAKQLGILIRNVMAVTSALYEEFLSPEGLNMLSTLTKNNTQLIEDIAQPFLWPMNHIVRKAAQAGANDYLFSEKRNIRRLCWQGYFSIMQSVFATVGILLLAFAIK